MTALQHKDKCLTAARRVLTHIAETLDGAISVRLWDGSILPLGSDADPDVYISIRSPGVIGTILRRPTLENILLQYAVGNIDYHGADLIGFYEAIRRRGTRSRGMSSKQVRRKLSKRLFLRQAWPFLFARLEKQDTVSRYDGDDTGRDERRRDEKAFIQFHYDISNDFYQLFLDPEMQYSCAYFTDWNGPLEQAQHDKLEMICRKLRLEPGDRFLDIGCGWGGLLCHAVTHHGVQGHGVTLSQQQHDFAVAKVKRLGLTDRITIELKDYRDLQGEYDRIASIGMYEHIGIANYREYFGKVSSLLRDRGVFLNHGITRRAKRSKRKFRKITPGRRFILKYIFPGSELDHIGHTVQMMESSGFEVHDVEGWREHYARTTRLWCQRLEARKEEAIALVGEPRFRMWIAYLAGVSFAFRDGSLRIFQTVATKHRRKGPADLPPTRADLYRSGTASTGPQPDRGRSYRA